MEILVSNNKLRRTLESDAAMQKHYGTDMAKKIKLRLSSLAAAETLADFWPPNSGPERCHELIGDMKGIFSTDVKQPYRLLFKPVGEIKAEEIDLFQYWREVTTVDIIGIENTHG
jgi:proteic killer suppression protein